MRYLSFNTLVLVLFLSTIILGCATKTYYVVSEDNGYTEQKVSENVYQIRVKSRNIKDKKRVQDLFYLRAAELTRDSGYRYFFTVEKMEELTGMEGKAKPFKQRILIAIIYEDIVITGLVKFLSERKELAVKVYDAETVYRKNYYLIEERDAIFASTNVVTNTSQIVSTPKNQTESFTNAILQTDKVGNDGIGNTGNLEATVDETVAGKLEDEDTTNPQELEEPLEINLFDIE